MEQLLHFSTALKKERHKVFSPRLHCQFYIVLECCRASLTLTWTLSTLSREEKPPSREEKLPHRLQVFTKSLKFLMGKDTACRIAMVPSITDCEVFVTGTIISNLQEPL